VTDKVCYSPGPGLHGDELYRTIDGGQSWQESTPLPWVLTASGSYWFSCSSAESCAVVDPLTISPGRPLAEFGFTDDGGSHWNSSNVPSPSGMPGAFTQGLACADAAHCVVGVSKIVEQGVPPADLGTFLTTSDGGQTWAQAKSVSAASAGAVSTMTCTSDGSCLAISAGGKTSRLSIVGLSSHDWGETWVAALPAVYPNSEPLYASCGDATHCMLVLLVGGSKAPYQIATTSDAGFTWHESGPPAGWLNMPTALACATNDDCWIALSHYSRTNPDAYSKPTIEATRDGGKTWSSLPLPHSTPPIADVLTLSCPPTGDGCMGIANLQDHFVANPGNRRLSGPLVISNLPLP
jgi:hypothetical protein